MIEDDLDGDDEMVDTTTLDANSGGRVRYSLEEEVRYVEMDGSISKEVYVVTQQRSDRKGHVSLRQREGTREVRVHFRRILPAQMDGKAVVIESQDRYWALCPEDQEPVDVNPGDDAVTCPKCSKTFTLHWMGARPMSEKTTTAEKAPKEPKAAKASTAAPKEPKAPKPPKEAKPKVEKEPKATKEPAKVDLAALAQTKGVELWTKKNVKFDHERIDVQAHVLLYVGDGPRKLCFNTYNDTLGKKGGELPVAAFLANATQDAKKNVWFAVTDLEKTRGKLQKDGYEQHAAK